MASDALEVLVLRLDADVKKLNRNLGLARRDANRKTKQIAKQFDTVQNSVDRLSRGYGNLSRVAVAAVGVMTTLVVGRAGQQVQAILDVSDKLGIQADKLVALHLVAETSQISIEKLNMGMQRMTRRVAEAARGTGEAQAAIKELGLDAQALARLAPDQQMEAIADAMAKVSTQGEKVRLAFKLFDSEGVDLVRMLKHLENNGLRVVEERARQLGLTFSKLDGKQLDEANTNMTLLKKTAGGFLRQVAIKLAPVFAELSETILKNKTDVRLLASATVDAGEVMSRAMGKASLFFDGIGTAITGARFVMLETAKQLLIANKAITPESAHENIDRMIRNFSGAARKAALEFHDDLANFGNADRAIEAFFDRVRARQTQLLSGGGGMELTVGAARTESPDALREIENMFGTQAQKRAQAEEQRLSMITGLQNEGFEAELERLIVQHEAKLEKIEQFKQQELILEETAKNKKAALNAKFEAQITDKIAKEEKRRLALQRAARLANLGQFIGGLSQLFGALAQHSKKAFKLQKVAAIAESGVHLAGAIIKALNSSTYPQNLAMAADVAARGAGFISAIKGTEFGGGGDAGGSVGGGGVAASAAVPEVPELTAVPEQRGPTNVNITLGSGVFGADAVRQLIGEINEAIGDGVKIAVT